jgi:uncharacterized protein YggT (Ycf19 family)
MGAWIRAIAYLLEMITGLGSIICLVGFLVDWIPGPHFYSIHRIVFKMTTPFLKWMEKMGIVSLGKYNWTLLVLALMFGVLAIDGIPWMIVWGFSI